MENFNLMWFITIAFIFSSCSISNHNKFKLKTYENIKLKVISPFGCIEELSLNSEGKGTLKSGRKNADIIKDSIDFDTVFVINNFEIRNSNKLNEFNKIIQSITDKQSEKYGFKYDTYRFQLFVDGINKIDTFGESTSLFELIKIIVDSLPFTSNHCDYFLNFKVNHS